MFFYIYGKRSAGNSKTKFFFKKTLLPIRCLFSKKRMDEITLTKKEAEELLNYLARRPYLEVYHLINMIQVKFSLKTAGDGNPDKN